MAMEAWDQDVLYPRAHAIPGVWHEIPSVISPFYGVTESKDTSSMSVMLTILLYIFYP